MANGKTINGKDLLLFIKRDSDLDYMLAACQVDLTFTMTRDVSSETTKCGTSKSFGPLNATASFNGEARVDIDPGDDAISWNEVSAIIKNESEVSVKIVSFNPNIPDINDKIYIEGDAKLSQAEITADSTTAVKFSSNIEFTDPESVVLEAPTT